MKPKEGIHMATKPSKRTPGAQIRKILGLADDKVITAVQGTGASRAEILRAHQWLADDAYLGRDAANRGDGKVRKVYDILRQDRDRHARDLT